MTSVVVVTSRERGTASVCLPALLDVPGVRVAGVIRSLNQTTSRQRSRARRRKFCKMLKIGPLGAWNGVRMRAWYGSDLDAMLGTESIDDLCTRRGVPLVLVPALNCDQTVDALRSFAPDLALSLGNGYIGERVFSTPRLGMLNVHHEELPKLKGAQGVIWQLYHGSATTGFTIHKIDKGIDTGAIVYQERVPIEFGASIGETVTRTMATLLRRSAAALARVVSDAERQINAAKPQSGGKHFTTPTFWQYRRMVREHDRLRALAQRSE
ncbi:MAG: hypothetical protein KIT68_07300 [Phycisphaeraceae bacterium]|nr:hypothetical protein [Phycisphaeraceae bacterium]